MPHFLKGSIETMKEFVKNIEGLVSRCEDRKVEKAVTALLAYYPDDVYLPVATGRLASVPRQE